MSKEAETTGVPKKDTVKDDSKTPPKSTKEINGRTGPEPTRYGDWEKNGRCIDF